MRNEMLHVFRNDPVGREVYLQGLYFSKMAGLGVRVFLPQHRQFLMYFRDGVVTVELERSFVKYRDTAREHAAELAEQHGVEVGFLEPEHHTASTLPDLPVDFSAMCCPRSIGEPVGKLGVSDIGPMVRSIVRSASFPVFIPAPAHKEFQRIVVFLASYVPSFQWCTIRYHLMSLTTPIFCRQFHSHCTLYPGSRCSH